ncbi:hypothetical protein ACFRAQ_36130 [Nocardia sp. NPDC056611]|uniref:hypothetical protein n=1 Tax=Nocardia sp. NPDC056611 TaxID=3345877 RepID=UPI0036717C05
MTHPDDTLTEADAYWALTGYGYTETQSTRILTGLRSLALPWTSDNLRKFRRQFDYMAGDLVRIQGIVWRVEEVVGVETSPNLATNPVARLVVQARPDLATAFEFSVLDRIAERV